MSQIIRTQSPLIFYVNGKKITERNPNPECTLLQYLRENLRLCGTKLGCGEGGCGACTVMLSKVTNRQEKTVEHVAVNACLMPVCAVHGIAVTTVEGIGSTRDKLHPVQERIAKAHGSQCGFCTPGIVMSMYALLRNMPTPSMRDLQTTFQGNLCRCTGYRPIIEGYRTFTQEYQCEMGDKCCKLNGFLCGPNESSELFDKSEFQPMDASQEPIFPPELMLSDTLDTESLQFRNEDTVWFRATTLHELLTIKQDFPEAKIVVGNTEVGVEVKFKHFRYPVLVVANQVPELTKINRNSDGVVVGSLVTLTNIEKSLTKLIQAMPEYETRIYVAIVDMLQLFAGKQIRNVASIGGNIMTSSPISDLVPILTAANVRMEVSNLNRGTRYINMDKDFFTGYRKNLVDPDEILVSITIPKTQENQYFVAYKQAKRRDDDIAIVNMALSVTFKPGTDIITSLKIAYGGMAPTVVTAPKTSLRIIGMRWNEAMMEAASEELINELPLDGNAPGGMVQYRRSLTLSLFFKAYLEISQRLEAIIPGTVRVCQNERSGSTVFQTLSPKSAQVFENHPKKHHPGDPVGMPIVHNSGIKQATGEAIYCDDIPKYENELYLALVLSSQAHAEIVSVDATDALSLPGVHSFLSAKDLTTKQNYFGVSVKDEEVFAEKKVITQGQTIGAIVADTQRIAQTAARLVKIVYADLSPVIVTIEQAIACKSYFDGFPKTLCRGDVDQAFQEADVIVEGDVRMGGQEHFYMETFATIAIPRDSDELEIISSTQHPTDLQSKVSQMLGLPSSKIVVKAKRLGGGFGGKESRIMLVSLPCALAAYKLKRPVRCMLDRDVDMSITGARHPFYFKYKACATRDGLITGCDINIYNNGGCTMDMSASVLFKAMIQFYSSYYIPNIRCNGWVCRTNLSSNTAFRGFGGPQGMFAGEHIIRKLAKALNMDSNKLTEINLFSEGDRTITDQQLIDCNVRRCWTECLKQSEYESRFQKIQQFNRENRWKKRGIAIVPITYGIAYTIPAFNQGAALVHIYTDGAVLISHGGIEMGQGLHIKLIQVAAKVLEIPYDRIHISETATDKVPNTIATAASIGSDTHGMAVLNACTILMERLGPYKKNYPNETWLEWINRAWTDRVSLSATGYYATPGLNFDSRTNKGNAFNYLSYGAGCTEVEIDCLTGDHQVIRTDIVMDLGSSLNPAIDIGQIEGAFMQGYGLFTLEELIYSPSGTLYSRGPGMYKLPGFSDIPATFNVSLLKGATNPRAIYSSKAVGEPPLLSAISVFFAIKAAIAAARHEEGLDDDFELLSPATSCRIRMACQDKITKKIEQIDTGPHTPWNIMP